MRYVSKIHVLDVLDQVVVSGYVHAQDDQGGWSPEVYEFSWQVPGKGIDSAYRWLVDALSSALDIEKPPAPAGPPAAPPNGGLHSIYETGGTASRVMG